MPLTRQQKEDIVSQTVELLKKSNGVIFTDFTGVGVESIRRLRRSLKEIGATYQATKRTLVRITFKKTGVDAADQLVKTSMGMVFFLSDLPATAKVLYEFSRKEKNFKILNAFDFTQKQWVESKEVIALAKLPPRQDLLTQLVYVLSSPMRKLAYVVDQIAKN